MCLKKETQHVSGSMRNKKADQFVTERKECMEEAQAFWGLKQKVTTSRQAPLWKSLEHSQIVSLSWDQGLSSHIQVSLISLFRELYENCDLYLHM